MPIATLRIEEKPGQPRPLETDCRNRKEIAAAHALHQNVLHVQSRGTLPTQLDAVFGPKASAPLLPLLVIGLLGTVLPPLEFVIVDALDARL